MEGKIILIVSGEEYHAGPGDSWSIPGEALHSARVLEDSIIIEVFAPVREDYLP